MILHEHRQLTVDTFRDLIKPQPAAGRCDRIPHTFKKPFSERSDLFALRSVGRILGAEDSAHDRRPKVLLKRIDHLEHTVECAGFGRGKQSRRYGVCWILSGRCHKREGIPAGHIERKSGDAGNCFSNRLRNYLIKKAYTNLIHTALPILGVLFKLIGRSFKNTGGLTNPLRLQIICNAVHMDRKRRHAPIERGHGIVSLGHERSRKLAQGV